MTLCPNCKQAELIAIENNNPEIVSRVCPNCRHYSSNSEAFASNPTMFLDIGAGIIGRLISNLKEHGLNEQEAQAWLRSEPQFVGTKRIVTPLNSKQQGNRTWRLGADTKRGQTWADKQLRSLR